MIKRTLTVPGYKCKVILIIGKSSVIDEQIDLLCKKYKIKQYSTGEDAACVITTYNTDLYYVLYSTEYISLKIFVHEIGHLAAFIFNHRGKKISGSRENFANLCGLLAEKFAKVFKENKIKL